MNLIKLLILAAISAAKIVSPFALSAQTIVPPDLIPFSETSLCKTSLKGAQHYVLYDEDEDALSENYSYRERFLGKTNNIDCPSFISLRLLTPNLNDNERSVFCLDYDEEQDTIAGYSLGERDAHLGCKEPSKSFCHRVNDTKEEALTIAGIGAGASGAATIATSTAGITAVTHSSGAVILTGSSGYIAGTLGTIGSSLTALLTAPATLTAAGISLVAVGGAVYFCSDADTID